MQVNRPGFRNRKLGRFLYHLLNLKDPLVKLGKKV